MKTLRSVGVHDGTFHADEVSACALLVIFDLVDPEKIIRVRDPKKLANCEFVCDVGGVYDPDQKLFDHHQVSYRGELSSAGMVLAYLREKGVITEEEFFHLNHCVVMGVDAHDNGRSSQEVGVCTFSHIIANFNPIHYEPSSHQLEGAFFEALHFSIGHLRRVHERFQYILSCRSEIKREMEKEKICLFFDRALPWLESFFALDGEKHPALFIVMPSGQHWKLRGIPPDYAHRMEVRLSLPDQWAGLLGEELKKVSGIEGAIFCHKGHFISVWETREDAIKALKFVLKSNEIIYEDTF